MRNALTCGNAQSGRPCPVTAWPSVTNTDPGTLGGSRILANGHLRPAMAISQRTAFGLNDRNRKWQVDLAGFQFTFNPEATIL